MPACGAHVQEVGELLRRSFSMHLGGIPDGGVLRLDLFDLSYTLQCSVQLNTAAHMHMQLLHAVILCWNASFSHFPIRFP